MAEPNRNLNLNNLKVEKIADGTYRDLATGAIIPVVTTVYQKLKDAYFKEKKTIIVLEGGTRSSKSFSSMGFAINLALSNKLSIGIGRRTLERAKRTVIKDMIEILKSWNMYNINSHNLTDHVYTFPNDSTISFIVAPDEESVKGAKFDVVILDDATEFLQTIYNQLVMRTKYLVILSANPSTDKNHWIQQTLLKKDEYGNYLNKRVKYLHSSFVDNPFLSEENVKSIKSLEPTPENILSGTADKCRWEIYGLGIFSDVTGQIFKYETVESFPEDLEHVCYGLDFGYGDPCVLIKKGERTEETDGVKYDCIYLDEVIYESDLITTRNSNNPDVKSIQGRFEEESISKTIPIYADSAEPDRILDLSTSGYNVLPVKKTQGADRSGSIAYGISIMNSYKIFITERSENLIKEFKFYRNEKRGEKIVRVGIDHGIDASRYACLSSCPKVYVGKGRTEPVRVKMLDEDTLRKYG